MRAFLRIRLLVLNALGTGGVETGRGICSRFE
jgi:hypothetical protein